MKISEANTFRNQLQSLINRYSMESESNTPDFILAEYLESCLFIFDRAVNQREKWHGRKELSPAEDVVTRQPRKIFSGIDSVPMWEDINNAKSKSDLRDALYFVCVKIQELESKIDSIKE